MNEDTQPARPCRICGRCVHDHSNAESALCLRGYVERAWPAEPVPRPLWRLLLPLGVQCFGLGLAVLAASSPAGGAGFAAVLTMFTFLTWWTIRMIAL